VAAAFKAFLDMQKDVKELIGTLQQLNANISTLKTVADNVDTFTKELKNTNKSMEQFPAMLKELQSTNQNMEQFLKLLKEFEFKGE
jgi:septal ring factor EnvC (AmiA/AmiB activator)